ncbi:amidohydrolase [Keratinibaculum paraultunense]|uniref:Peptidase M20 domain-containing protein 2 n=1 Tax=Keratinibaculum paraultunense TaxID=1278232 RepID=A0A4R3KZD9_9FIRM|nr:amidohydrolase [Keratinibaculum paraultunense]QQY79982.1 amidohydrolase [Keratinibaculum paraultunense]TCS91696.1 amidohydrolase [Keratinibaculum paraultunense]
MGKEYLKEKVCNYIDEKQKEIIHIGETIFDNPELGFKEIKTAQLIKKTFMRMNIAYEDNIAITGIKATVKGKKQGPKVAIIGELDAVKTPEHPRADKLTGAAHSCGHNAQLASMIGAAYGLVSTNIIDELAGQVCFIAAPAEEFVELEYRKKLKEEGKIQFFSGKQELIRIGVFDDIDIAMMVHSHANTKERKVFLNGSSTGFIAKEIRYIGKAAHAGGNPYDGVNALNAAIVAITAINAQRETFRDEDGIRVHPIITKGGDLVNVVPSDVRLETYVRGKNSSSILKANGKVDRSFKAGAYAIGAKVKILDIPGYLPLFQDTNLSNIFEQNVSNLVEYENIIKGVDMIGSTDIGDLSHIIPVIQPTMGGYEGSAHGADFKIYDPYMAYIIPAKAMAMTVIDLLYEDGKIGKDIIKNFKPKLTKQEYLRLLNNIGV